MFTTNVFDYTNILDIGVIGTRVLPKGWVARKPSDIYWNGIRTFGIFCDYGLSIPEYLSLIHILPDSGMWIPEK